MRTLILRSTSILSLLFYTLAVHAQVFVDGVVYHYTEDNKPVQVTVMEDDQFYQSIETSKSGKFRVRLQPNHYYVINLSKPDHYITKIAVDTHVPFEVGPDYYTEIPLEADLVRKYIDMDPEVMKKPLSIFSYDAASETFIQDDEYLKEARAQLEAFLYEAEQAEKKSTGELAIETPEKSTKNIDSLNQENKNGENQITQNEATERSGLLASTNTDRDTIDLSADEKSLNEHQDQDEIALYDSRNNESNVENTSGPSAPQIENQNDTIGKESVDTVSMNTFKTGTSAEEADYSISISINGKEYDPYSGERIRINEELDIDIMGIPKDSYSEFNYKLDGKENDFNTLRDDEVDYDDLEEGNYTFILTNKDNNFDEIRVPLNVEKQGSDFPWVFIILGIVALGLIIVFSRRRKPADVENRSTVNSGIDKRDDIDDDNKV